MVGESIVKPSLRLFNLKWPPQNPQRLIGAALSFFATDAENNKYELREVTVVAGVEIINGELIVMDKAIYEITGFVKPFDYNYFESISLKHKGNL